MSTSPAPSVTRGEITLQPSYFTSSLYVHALREDISLLIASYAERYFKDGNDRKRPFALFKEVWNAQGWTWLHFKVFDARARERFIGATLRLFLERMAETESALSRTVGLFGMYTFFSIQPSTSAPPLFSLSNIPIPLDLLEAITTIPTVLVGPHLSSLRPYATHILSILLTSQVFHVLPESKFRPHSPTSLPREIFVQDNVAAEQSTSAAKKRGRPTKRDKARKAREAIGGLDRWLEKSTFTYPVPPTMAETEERGASTLARTTHNLIAHPPIATHHNYAIPKAELLEQLAPRLTVSNHARLSGEASEVGSMTHERINPSALSRANEAVLMRLRRIDKMAAEKGLEVGGEGGEVTGLGRMEKAVEELRGGTSRGGILNLLEGAGLGSAGSSG